MIEYVVHGALSALRRSAARRARREGTAWVLEYGPLWRWFTRAMWLFPLGIGSVAIFSPPNPGERWIPYAIIGGFSAILAPLTMEVFQRRIELTDQAIAQKSAWSKPNRIAWKDVRDVMPKLSGEVVVQPRSGRSVRVSLWLSGLETLAETLEKRVATLPSTAKAVAAIRRQLDA